jgi:hypothetical protein
MDIGRVIRDRVKAALDGKHGRTNIAIAVNRDGSSSHTTVYSDDDVTIVERDGERHVVRHDRGTSATGR